MTRQDGTLENNKPITLSRIVIYRGVRHSTCGTEAEESSFGRGIIPPKCNDTASSSIPFRAESAPKQTRQLVQRALRPPRPQQTTKLVSITGTPSETKLSGRTYIMSDERVLARFSLSYSRAITYSRWGTYGRTDGPAALISCPGV